MENRQTKRQREEQKRVEKSNETGTERQRRHRTKVRCPCHQNPSSVCRDHKRRGTEESPPWALSTSSENKPLTQIGPPLLGEGGGRGPPKCRQYKDVAADA